MRSSGEIERDIAAALDLIADVSRRLRDMRVELQSALFIEGERRHGQHPWLSKRVRYNVPNHVGRHRGILKIRGLAEHHRRGDWFLINPGDLYIESHSGKTAHRFSANWELEE